MWQASQKLTMSSLPEMPPSQGNMLEMILRYWPIIAGFVVIVLGYGTIQSNLKELQTRIAANEAATLTANASYADLSGDIKGINAKLDIILKKNDL